MDEFDLQAGEPETAWTTMQNALQHARFVMPVISQGYVDSRWCLDELVIMMASPANVMPVFYDITPDSDILIDTLLRCAYLRQHACRVIHSGRHCCLRQVILAPTTDGAPQGEG